MKICNTSNSMYPESLTIKENALALSRIKNYEIPISTFKNLDNSGYINKYATLSDIFDMIKYNHPQKDLILEARKSGKYSKEIFSVDKVYDYKLKKVVDKKRNLYEHIKAVKAPVVNFSAHFDKRRAKKNVEKVLPFMYIDIDEFTDVLSKQDNINTIEAAKEYVWDSVISNDMVVAGWRSFGGKGFGFLLFVPNLTLDNIKSTWEYLANSFKENGIVLDPAVKDITRCNVVSYDPDMFLREPSEIRPFLAVDPKKRKTTKLGKKPLPNNLVGDVMSNSLNWLYNDETNWNKQEGRLSYNFYQKFFSISNQHGIKQEDAYDFLIANVTTYPKLFQYRSEEDVEYISSQQYSYYSSQFGQAVYEDYNDDEMYSRVIHSIYNEYQHSVEYKLLFLHGLYDKSKDYVISMAIKAKHFGITKGDLIKFLNKMKKTSRNTHNLLKQVYGNLSYPYGIDFSYTEAAIKLQIEKYRADAKANGYEIKKAEEHFENIEAEMERFLENYPSTGVTPSINAIQFFKVVFKKAKSLGVSKEFLKQAIKNQINVNWDTQINIKYSIKPFDYDFEKLFEVLYESIIEYNSHLNGFLKIRTISIEELENRYEISETHTLKRSKGEYISSLNLSTDENITVWGDTGQGKTHWVCNHVNEHRILLVPVQLLLEGIDMKYDTSVYYEHKKNVNEGDKLIICSYSSFPNLVKVMEKWSFSFDRYKLFMDEHHNLAAAAAKGYRNHELNNILDNAHRFKNFITLTGTLFPLFHPVIQSMKIVRVKWDKTPIKKLTPVVYSDKNFAISKRLSKDKKNLIFLQSKNDHGKLGELIEYLKLDGHKGISYINSSTKNTDDFSNIIEKELMKKGTQTLIATSVMVEGVTLLDADVATVHFVSHPNDLIMEQFMNRLRTVFTKNNGAGCMGFMYISQERYENVKGYAHYDVVEQQKRYIKLAEYKLKFFSGVQYEDTGYIKTINKNFGIQMMGESFLYRSVNGYFTVDYLAIAEKTFTEEKYASYGNIEFLKTKLAIYNWQFMETEFDNGEFSSQEKETISTIQDGKGITHASKLDDFNEEAKQMQLAEINSILDDPARKNALTSIEGFEDFISILSKHRYLYKYFDKKDVHSIMDDLAAENYSSGKWEQYVRQIRAQVSSKGVKKFVKKYSDKFKSSILFYYKRKVSAEVNNDKKIYSTVNQLINVIENRKGLDNNLKNIKITKPLMFEIMEHFFTMKSKLFKNGVRYRLDGLNIVNDVELINERLFEWAKEHLEKGTKFTTKQLASEINQMRVDLPILNKFKVHNRNVLKLLNDYFTVERKSRSIVEEDGRRVTRNTYEVTDLRSELFQKYNVKSDCYQDKFKSKRTKPVMA